MRDIRDHPRFDDTTLRRIERTSETIRIVERTLYPEPRLSTLHWLCIIAAIGIALQFTR